MSLSKPKKSAFSKDNLSIIRSKIDEICHDYECSADGTDTAYRIPNSNASEVYGKILDTLAENGIDDKILNLHVVVLDWQDGAIIRIRDREEKE